MMWLIGYLFDRFRWWRRWRGGHWEKWWIMPPVASEVWIQKQHDEPPPFGAKILDACEDWPRTPHPTNDRSAKGE